MDTVIEISDPSAPRTFQGNLLAYVIQSVAGGGVQSWKVLDTEKHGQMLFIDNVHQSSLSDEHLYHETFVHGLMYGLLNPKKVLILGGSEGCLAREVLKWKSVEHITQVDWDKDLIDYFRGPGGAPWNGGVYEDPRVNVVIAEALSWLKENDEVYDAIFVDLLDPSDTTMGLLRAIMSEAKRHLSPTGGGISVNAGNVCPSVYTKACVLAEIMKLTYEEPRFHRVASRVNVPSFYGDWCFLMAVPKTWSSKIHSNADAPDSLRFFNTTELTRSTLWPSFYPDTLTTFWQRTENEVAAAAAAAKKLAEEANLDFTKDISEYYGC